MNRRRKARGIFFSFCVVTTGSTSTGSVGLAVISTGAGVAGDITGGE